MTFRFGVPLIWTIKHSTCILPKPKRAWHFLLQLADTRAVSPSQKTISPAPVFKDEHPCAATNLSHKLIASGQALLARKREFSDKDVVARTLLAAGPPGLWNFILNLSLLRAGLTQFGETLPSEASRVQRGPASQTAIPIRGKGLLADVQSAKYAKSCDLSYCN